MQLSQNSRITTLIENVTDILDAFRKIFKLHAYIYAPDGKYNPCCNPDAANKNVHQIVKFFPGAVDICSQCRQNSILEADRWGETYISQCNFGFYQMGIPMLKHEELIGGIIACPFFMRKPTADFIKKIVSRQGFSSAVESKFMSAIRQIPIIDEKKTKLAADMLFSIADYLSTPNLEILQARKELMREQAQVAEEVQQYKQNSRSADHHLLPILNVGKEQELITKVRLGDKIAAKKILNEFLGQVMLHNPINIEILKAYVLELAIILTRAVVEKGANAEAILGMRYQFVSELADISDRNKLCFWVVKVMESICDNIYQTRNNHHFRILEKACNFIKQNYKQKLTLSIVAKEIYISPFYLCHLYKEELNTTFSDYLTRTRIEAARELLHNSRLSLAQIALEVGYPDQSYFTKVFKKLEKITPKTYRKLISEHI